VLIWRACVCGCTNWSIPKRRWRRWICPTGPRLAALHQAPVDLHSYEALLEGA